jgi:hypothetical protein
MCLDTAHDPIHKTCDCPILKKIGLKLEKQAAANNAASHVTTDATTPTPSAIPPSASTPLTDNQSGSATIPGGFTALAEQALYDSGDEFDGEGNKANGAMYGSANPYASSAYLDSSCHHVSVVPGQSPHIPPTYNMVGIPNTASVMNMGVPSPDQIILWGVPPHKGSTQSTSQRPSLLFSITCQHIQLFTLRALSANRHLFSLRTLEQQIICCLTSQPSSPTIPCQIDASKWAIIPLPPLLATVPP